MKIKRARFTENEIDELAKMYSEGTSVYKICKLLNRSETSVKNYLKRLNVFVPSPEMILEADELKLNWLYWILIPFFVLNANTNPLEMTLYYVFI